MSVGAVASSPSVQPSPQAVQARASSAKDNDGDEAVESSAEKSKEAASAAPSKPVDSNRGNNLNISV